MINMSESVCQTVYRDVCRNKAATASDTSVRLCSVPGRRTGATAAAYAGVLASYIDPEAVCPD